MAVGKKQYDVGELLKDVLSDVGTIMEEMNALRNDIKKDFKEIKDLMNIVTEKVSEQKNPEATLERKLGDSVQSQEEKEEEPEVTKKKLENKIALGKRGGKENIRFYFKKKNDEVQGRYDRQDDFKDSKMGKERLEKNTIERKGERKRVRRESDREEERGGRVMKGGNYRKKKRDEG